jgi:hypothetical protein
MQILARDRHGDIDDTDNTAPLLRKKTVGLRLYTSCTS